jgi:hypothetical protein
VRCGLFSVSAGGDIPWITSNGLKWSKGLLTEASDRASLRSFDGGG